MTYRSTTFFFELLVPTGPHNRLLLDRELTLPLACVVLVTILYNVHIELFRRLQILFFL